MTYYYSPRVSTHKKYYANPLSPNRSLWKLQLIHKSWRKEKHMTSKGDYFRIVFLPKRRYKKKNPLCQYLMSKNELKIWGKFHR